MYTINKPSENMNKSMVEINRMIHEQQIQEQEEEQKRTQLEESIRMKELNENQVNMLEYQQSINKTANAKREFLQNVKNSLLSECIFKLYKDSTVAPLTESDKVIARNLVNKFVLENGAGELLLNFKHKNLLLSEFSRITNKYYQRILEECDDESCDPEKAGKAREFSIDDKTKEDFFDELEDVDTEDASKLIKERVSDAVSEFIDNNENQKLEYEDIIKSAQDRIAEADESYAESYTNQAKRTINEMRLNAKKNIFHYMVESLCKNTFKNDKLKTKYLNESTLNMDNIVNDSMLIYNMLEMVNTTNMVNVDEEYMRNYVKSLA